MALIKIYDTLCLRVREALESGKKVVVCGWMDKNHSPITRKLATEGKVVFLPADHHSIPRNGLVIFTRFVSHRFVAKVSREGFKTFPGSIETGQIKLALQSCHDILA